MYENLLHNNLFKRKEQLLSNIDEFGMNERKQEYDRKKAEFAQATQGMEATKKRLDIEVKVVLLLKTDDFA